VKGIHVPAQPPSSQPQAFRPSGLQASGLEPRASTLFDESRRLAAVQTPVIPIVSRWIAETPGTISLGQGIVSYPPPPEAMASLATFPASIADHRYGPVEGIEPLVSALETKLERENGIRVRPASRLVVTAGGNLAFMNAALAIADPGDEFIFPVPYYFNHEMAVVIAGCRAVPVPTTRDYHLDLDAIARAITPRTRAVVTVSPNNPTGTVYPEAALRAVNALCRDRGVFHIHDEAYEYFTYEGTPHFSPGSIADAAAHTISLYSLSKAYGFASWRIGYQVIPESIWEAINKIQDTDLICAPAISQHVALAAIGVGAGYARAHLPKLDAMRRLISHALRAGAPCDVPDPRGAFYYFLRVHTTLDAMTLAERLIREHRIAVIPGSAFGANDACYVRVSFGALDEATVELGVGRLVRGLTAIAGRA
jgi:aspartate/methionine/tyrosine aminotransferase